MEKNQKNSLVVKIKASLCNRVQVKSGDNDPYEKTVSTQKTRMTGLGPGGLVTETHSIDIFGNTTIHENYVDRTLHTSAAVTDFPDATVDAIALSRFGLLVSSSDKAGVTTLFDYDALGRNHNHGGNY